MKTILYKKVGDSYEAVQEYDPLIMDAMPYGAHLIVVSPGGQSGRYNVDPAYAPMIAAGKIAEDVMTAAIVNASELRPRSRKPLTKHQQELYNSFINSLDDESRYYLETCSIREAVDSGIKAMQEEAMKLMKYESVKNAYDQFLLTCELCKEYENV